MINLNDELYDLAIRHSHYLQRYATHEVNKVLSFLNNHVYPDAYKDLMQRMKMIRLLGYDKGPYTTKLINDAISHFAGTIRGGATKAYKGVKKDLKDLALAESEWQASVLNAATNGIINFTFKTPTIEHIKSIIDSKPFKGDLLSKHFSDLSKNVSKKLEKQLQLDMIRGNSFSRISQDIRKALNISRDQAAALTRTSVNFVSNESRLSTYQANSDVISGWQFIATLDVRTTDICISLHLQIYKLNEGAADAPPQHIRCRSTTRPLLKTWKELRFKGLTDADPSKQAAFLGPVKFGTSYGEWLQKQPIKFQNMAIGKGKAELLRQGKIKVEDLAYKTHNQEWKSITLKELKKSL